MSLLYQPAPYHILAYGTLLGTQFFQSFVGGIVAYRALPRPQFAQLQTAIFPVYFGLQSTLTVLLALTYPGSSLQGHHIGAGSGLMALVRDDAARTDLICIAATGLMGLLNWLLLGPWTTQIMRERKHQETRDGRKSYDAPPHSAAMQRLNRRFATMHGWSSLANMVALVATVVYGFTLGESVASKV